MPLDKNMLKAAIEATMNQAKEYSWPVDQVAQSLADAIDLFVRSGDVVGVTTSVTVGSSTGTGTQSNTGRIQ